MIGVLPYQYDVIILVATRKEHDSRFEPVLTRLVQRNIPIKETGCEFGVPERNPLC